MSYKQIYKKNLEYKLKKEKRGSGKNLPTLDNTPVLITFDMIKDYLNEHDHKDLLLKFMIRVHRLMISKKVFGASNAKPKRKKISRKKETGGKSDNDYSDNSYISKGISDNEVKSKENFYNVMQNVTKNMLNDIKSSGNNLSNKFDNLPSNEITKKIKSNDNSQVKIKK